MWGFLGWKTRIRRIFLNKHAICFPYWHLQSNSLFRLVATIKTLSMDIFTLRSPLSQNIYIWGMMGNVEVKTLATFCTALLTNPLLLQKINIVWHVIPGCNGLVWAQISFQSRRIQVRLPLNRKKMKTCTHSSPFQARPDTPLLYHWYKMLLFLKTECLFFTLMPVLVFQVRPSLLASTAAVTVLPLLPPQPTSMTPSLGTWRSVRNVNSVLWGVT